MSDLMVKPSTKPELSDAQFATLTQVARADRDEAIRFVDTRTVMTLTALAKRGYVALAWGPVDGRPRGITRAAVLRQGALVLARETERRTAVAAYDARLAAVLDRNVEAPVLAVAFGAAGETPTVVASTGIAARMDPFEVIRTGSRRQAVIPF